MADADVCRRWEARPLLEGGELALLYFQSERLVFSSSVLPPGQRSSRDPGHPGADEVVYCVEGEVVVELGHGERDFVRLEAGDAALIHDGVPHSVYNPQAAAAKMVWCAAPSLGRPLLYES